MLRHHDFSISEPTVKQNAKLFTSAIMKIWTCFDFPHTIVVNTDSKFGGIFEEIAELLGINMQVLSRGNHGPILIERVDHFLNASLKIFCNERETNRIS